LDGVNQVYTPTAGGDRTNTGDGWSDISLLIPQGNTNLAVDLYVRANANGEDWWIDNIELFELSALPVELVEFDVKHVDDVNVLFWKTASEHNAAYFILKRSNTLQFDENSVIAQLDCVGNSTDEVSYTFNDKTYENQINYYQLTQVDLNGESTKYNVIAIDNRISRNAISRFNLLGQPVDENYHGIVLETLENGTVVKRFNH
jgi:hypothetical protein